MSQSFTTLQMGTMVHEDAMIVGTERAFYRSTLVQAAARQITEDVTNQLLVAWCVENKIGHTDYDYLCTVFQV